MTTPPTPSPSQPSQEAMELAIRLGAINVSPKQVMFARARLIDAHTAGLRREVDTAVEMWNRTIGELQKAGDAITTLRADLARLTSEQRAVKAACNFDISGDSSVETTVRRQYALLCDTIRQCKQLEQRVHELERSQA